MRTLLFCFSILGLCTYANSQYCVTGGPTSLIDSNIESVSIIGASGSINYSGCPGALGVVEYTAETVSLGSGNNYSIDVQFGTCGGNYNGAGEIWIDFNQNFVFEASESIGTWAGIPPTAMSTFNFTVPPTAMMGATKMRIIQQEGGAIPIDPCASFSWGSVTDFNVIIIGGIDCSGFSGDDMADAIDVTTLPYTDNHANTVCYTNQNPTYSSPDVYYRVTTNPVNPWINVSLCGSNFDTFLSIIEPNGTFITGNDDSGVCSPQSEILLNTENYPVIYVIVEGWGTEIGDYILNINDNLSKIGTIGLENIQIYPNPASHSFSLTNEQEGIIEIRDITGSLIMSGNLLPFANVSIKDFSSGVYYIKFIVGENYIVKKIIKR